MAFISSIPFFTSSSTSTSSTSSLRTLSSRPYRYSNPCTRVRMLSSPDPTQQPQNPTPTTVSSSSTVTNDGAKPTGVTSTTASDMTSLDIDVLMEKAKDAASDVTDRPLFYSKIVGYGVGALVVLTILKAIVAAIDSLPVLPSTLELIGLAYTGWFVWRYVVFRESRAELLEEIDDFLGRTRPGGGSK